MKSDGSPSIAADSITALFVPLMTVIQLCLNHGNTNEIIIPMKEIFCNNLFSFSLLMLRKQKIIAGININSALCLIKRAKAEEMEAMMILLHDPPSTGFAHKSNVQSAKIIPAMSGRSSK